MAIKAGPVRRQLPSCRACRRCASQKKVGQPGENEMANQQVRRFELPSGRYVWIETTDLGTSDARKGQRLDAGLKDRARELAADATQTFQEAWQGIEEVIALVVKQMERIGPGEVEIKLGLKLSGEM